MAEGVVMTEDSDEEERVLSSYEQEVGVVNVGSGSYEEVDEAVLQQHLMNFDDPNSHSNEFAELDPYLTLQQQPMNSDPAKSPKGNSPVGMGGSPVEVGVDVTGGEVGGVAGEEGEESASPIESVLYSHSHY